MSETIEANCYSIIGGSQRTGRALTSGAPTVWSVDTGAPSATAGIPLVPAQDFNADAWSRWFKIADAAFTKARTQAKAGPSASARLRVQRLAAIQSILGLSTSDFAQALGLSRPGLYKWLDASNDVKLQGASRERLAAIERISQKWLERSTAPLSTVAHEPIADGRTVLSLLVGEHLDETMIIGAYDELLDKLAGRPKSRSRKMADAGFKRRRSPKSLPSDE